VGLSVVRNAADRIAHHFVGHFVVELNPRSLHPKHRVAAIIFSLLVSHIKCLSASFTCRFNF